MAECAKCGHDADRHVDIGYDKFRVDRDCHDCDCSGFTPAPPQGEVSPAEGEGPKLSVADERRGAISLRDPELTRRAREYASIELKNQGTFFVEGLALNIIDFVLRERDLHQPADHLDLVGDLNPYTDINLDREYYLRGFSGRWWVMYRDVRGDVISLDGKVFDSLVDVVLAFTQDQRHKAKDEGDRLTHCSDPDCEDCYGK